MVKKAVILLSGGLDSAVCLAIAKNLKYECYSLTVDYGQKSRFELKAAERISAFFNVKKQLKLLVDLRGIGDSALTTDAECPLPSEMFTEKPKGVPVTYVPARNMILLSLAVSWAETLGAESVFIGANIRDYSGYPDCRLDFLKSFEETAMLGTKKSTKILIKAPLIRMSKAKIIKEGKKLGVNFSLTSSCYFPSEEGAPCLKCESCRLREKGFREAEEKAKGKE